MKSKLLSSIFFLITTLGFSQTKILFDASKAQMAGNADWIVDADILNIRFTGGSASLGGFESNPQQVPTPQQSLITNNTSEDFWSGAASAWAVDCAKLGYIVESLPYNKTVTYGDSNNPQDLSNYKIFVTIEPNILYSASEKIAILNFVQNGGGLFMVSGHDGADRNFDGFDAVGVLNDLTNNNGQAVNPFGITFNVMNTGNIISTNIANIPNNPILNGNFGTISQIKYFQGATMAINTNLNNNAKGLVYLNGFSNTSNNNILFASSQYGSGKIVALGDSSPIDDGTGDAGDNLFYGYSDANGNHRNLIMNATQWLATTSLTNSEFDLNGFNFNINPNPVINNQLTLNYLSNNKNNFIIEIYDLMGRIVQTNSFSNLETGFNSNIIQMQNLDSGIYLCKINNEFGSKSLRFLIK